MKIIVIDDEKHIRRLLGDFLRNEGFEVIEGIDGIDGIEKIIQNKDIDLILLDIRMPKMDGFKAFEEIRRICEAPVIFLTALDDIQHEVKGIDIGAYDYITKPFNYEILIARIKGCIRKTKQQKAECIQIDGCCINLTNREILVDGINVGATQKEMEIIELLINNKNVALDRTIILDRVWGYDYYGDSRTVDTHIKTLRGKMKEYGSLIKTIRGVGYFIEIK